MIWRALILAMLLSWPALAQQPQCGEHKEAVDYLSSKYGERLAGQGITAGNSVLELYTSATGSWTMLLILPSGKACLAGSGEDWEAIAPDGKPPGRDTKS